MSDPLKPTGWNNEAIFDQKVHESAFGPVNKLLTSRTVKVSRTHAGIVLRVKQAKGGSAPAAATQIKYLSFKQSLGDYFLATDSTGKIYQVAKPYKLRNSISRAVIYGSQINYTYPHNPVGGGISADKLAYLYRVATLNSDSTQTENEGVVPQYLPANVAPNIIADIIEAIQVPNTGVISVADGSGIPANTIITWQDQNIDGRAWALFSNPAF